MKFPYPVMWRKKEFARIYAPTGNYPFYRLSYRAGGRRIQKSFGTFTAAKQEGLDKAKEIWGGDDNAALSPAEATAMLEISRALAKFRQETGRNIVAGDIVKDGLAALRLLPPHVGLVEAIRDYSATIATLRPCLLADAIAQFTKEREALTRQTGEDGRVLLHPTYHRDVTRVLKAFDEKFSGFRVGELTAEHVKLWAEPLRGMRRKTANNARAALRMFFRWCADDTQRYLLPDSPILKAKPLELDRQGKAPSKDFYRPAELSKLLANADPELLPVLALQALAGVRSIEALRMTWRHVFERIGHIEIDENIAKTRQQRLVEIQPPLASWLEPYRGKASDAPVWPAGQSGYVIRFRKLRLGLKIPARKNGLRKGFVSHAFVKFGKQLAAQWAGHDEELQAQNYKGLVTKSEAEAWFAVAPSKAANVVTLREETA